MKKIIFAFLLFPFFAHSYAQDAAAIKFINKDTVYDFGIMNPGDNAAYSFEFKNTGKEPLIISNVKSENSNLKFKWPSKALKHGKKGIVTVTYTSPADEETSSFKNDIFIASSATKEPYPFLHVSGAVIPAKGSTQPQSAKPSKKASHSRRN